MLPFSNAADLLSEVLRYPKSGLCDTARNAAELFIDICPDMRDALSDFANTIQDQSESDIEELFTYSFDFSPSSAMELGWHLFGESYDRGLFLVWMRQKLREHGIPENADLPDHLSHAIQILARLETEAATGFSTLCILPAVTRIISGFKDGDNPYRVLLVALSSFLTTQFGAANEEGTVSLAVLNQHEDLFSLESV